MDQLVVYIGLFTIIVIIGQVFNKSSVPLSLILVMAGMVLSIIPDFPRVNLRSDIVLNIFLPVIIYQISTYSSWKDVKKSLSPIISLSFGHVVFITVLVAVTIHALIPQLGWGLSFVLGSVISPPDDIAIVSIADKIRMPTRIVTILEGEGLLNDATALILFRFSLAAVVTHEFSPLQAFSTFLLVVAGETAWGLLLGNALGQLRLRIKNPILHIMASILTPFLAYLPAEKMGGSGVLATVVTGFVIGHVYSVRFTPEFRLISRAVWPMLAFALQNILFLLVGLDMLSIVESISSIPFYSLMIYSGAVILVVVVGRFFWVYVALGYLPRLLFPRMRAKSRPRWQSLFIVSWSGMRGGVSLAAALSVPAMTMTVEGANAKDLLLFLIFCVIIATFLLQGLTLPWLIKFLGVQKYGQREKYNDHISELSARVKITKAVRRWLHNYRKIVKDDKKTLDQVKLYSREYKMLQTNLEDRIGEHSSEESHDEKLELQNEVFLLAQIIEIERAELLQLWKQEKINLGVRNKLMEHLDHRSKHLPD
jgi:monovalent cation/hydrogen antiporter